MRRCEWRRSWRQRPAAGGACRRRRLAHLLMLGLHVGKQGGQRHQVPLQVPALPQRLQGRNEVRPVSQTGESFGAQRLLLWSHHSPSCRATGNPRAALGARLRPNHSKFLALCRALQREGYRRYTAGMADCREGQKARQPWKFKGCASQPGGRGARRRRRHLSKPQPQQDGDVAPAGTMRRLRSAVAADGVVAHLCRVLGAPIAPPLLQVLLVVLLRRPEARKGLRLHRAAGDGGQPRLRHLLLLRGVPVDAGAVLTANVTALPVLLRQAQSQAQGRRGRAGRWVGCPGSPAAGPATACTAPCCAGHWATRRRCCNTRRALQHPPAPDRSS